MNRENQRILLASWLQGKNIADIKSFYEDDFTDENKALFNAIESCLKAKLPLEENTLNLAKKSGMRPADVSQIMIEYYPGLYEQVISTEYQNKASEYLRESYDQDPVEVRKTLEKYTIRPKGERPTAASNLMFDYFDELDRRLKQENVVTGMKTFDRMLGGVRTKELTAVCARPSVGKSTYALQVALNIARQKKKVMFIPLEMSKLQTMERIIMMRCDINHDNVRKGELNESEWDELQRFGDEYAKLEQSGNWLIYEGANKIEQIEQLIIEEKPYAVFIDQLEQLRSTSERFKDKRERFSYMTNNLKRISMEHDVAVWLACQINRSGSEEPTLENIKESGSVEEDSDNVILLHRMHKERLPEEDVKIILAKQRSGPTGEISTKFIAKCFLFLETISNVS